MSHRMSSKIVESRSSRVFVRFAQPTLARFVGIMSYFAALRQALKSGSGSPHERRWQIRRTWHCGHGNSQGWDER